MFRRKEDEVSASTSQPQSANPAPNPMQTPFAAPAQKPAAPSFGTFGSAPATPAAPAAASAPAVSAEEVRKPVTAPLTTQQVGLGAPGSSSPANAAPAAPKPAIPAANAPAAPAAPAPQAQAAAPAGSSFAPSYNKVPSPIAAPAQIPAAPAPSASQSSSKLEGIEAERRLTVGYGITLTGEVSDCDRLVIYGKVNAKLANVKFLQISDSGKFNGSAQIEQAEISGVFEGELKVTNNITITSTGRVNGKITYGSIEIRPGGKFTGEIIEDSSQLSQNSGSDSSSGQYGLNSGASNSTSDKAA